MALKKSSDPIKDYGFTAIPRDPVTLLAGVNPERHPPKSFTLDSIPMPSAPLIEAVKACAKRDLNQQTLNHSMRVAYFGLAIHTQYLPHLPLSHEAYLLASLLHDIGTTPKNIHGTHLSFEFYGGYLALQHLLSLSACVALSESVTEAIIRHQDLGTTGSTTIVGAVLQLATIIDNMGIRAELLHRETIEAVAGAFPRMGWSGCFAGVIRDEIGAKPWCHSTHLGEKEFAEGVEGYEVMRPYE